MGISGYAYQLSTMFSDKREMHKICTQVAVDGNIGR